MRSSFSADLRSLIFKSSVLLVAIAAASSMQACKAKKKKSPPPAKVEDPKQSTQGTQEPASTALTVTIGGQGNGGTINASSTAINLPIEISGVDRSNITAVLVSAPNTIKLSGIADKNYVLTGSLPANTAQNKIELIFRNMPKCTSAGQGAACNIDMDVATGRSKSTITPNAAYDLAFSVTVAVQGGNFGGNGGVNQPGAPSNSNWNLWNPFTWFGGSNNGATNTVSSWFTNAYGYIKSGATWVWDQFKGLFT